MCDLCLLEPPFVPQLQTSDTPASVTNMNEEMRHYFLVTHVVSEAFKASYHNLHCLATMPNKVFEHSFAYLGPGLHQ